MSLRLFGLAELRSCPHCKTLSTASKNTATGYCWCANGGKMRIEELCCRLLGAVCLITASYGHVYRSRRMSLITYSSVPHTDSGPEIQVVIPRATLLSTWFIKWQCWAVDFILNVCGTLMTKSEISRNPRKVKRISGWENETKLLETNFCLKNRIFTNIYEKKMSVSCTDDKLSDAYVQKRGGK